MGEVATVHTDGANRPPAPLRLNKRQQCRMRRLLKKMNVVPYSPTGEEIAARLAELARLGLHDTPEWIGISSSVRQYAIATLTAEAGYYGSLPMPFVTAHADLLQQSVFLTLRYGVEPASPATLLARLSRESDDTSPSSPA